ncbi:MAG: alpha/beta fold hydrolase [Myxococcales bacterium]|nr:alpha/beta hydrolase [Myxococcales bacterium]
MHKIVKTRTLFAAYEEHGPKDGTPVVLLHGFPYDVRAYDEVVRPLAAAGFRAIVPFLRGYGPTRLLSDNALRAGQQAAIGDDLVALLDALEIRRAMLVGYDWGGRAACIVAALWPERVSSLVAIGGYSIQDIAHAGSPAPPEDERRIWYQYYFHTERGRVGLEANRRQLCRLLWADWSPSWRFDDATFARTAASFDNPDFVEIVIHSYRHRFGQAPGDPLLEPMERRLSRLPKISAPTLVLHGAADGVSPPRDSEDEARFFAGPYRREVVPGAGHNLPQEAPALLAEAILATSKELA